MYSKIIFVLAIIAAVSAQSHYGQQQTQPQHYHHDEEHYGPVHYEYHYDVHDDHTGD
uniref:Uncharacterized protein n=1 Tax=Anopheles atroparvus TaxID=41427 RepID=A0A182JKJ0_ANOAO